MQVTLEPTCKVHRYKVFWHIRSGFEWSQSQIFILARNYLVFHPLIGLGFEINFWGIPPAGGQLL